MSARGLDGVRLCDWCGAALAPKWAKARPTAITCPGECKERRLKRDGRTGPGPAAIAARADRRRERVELIEALEAAYSRPAASDRERPA